MKKARKIIFILAIAMVPVMLALSVVSWATPEDTGHTTYFTRAQQGRITQAIGFELARRETLEVHIFRNEDGSPYRLWVWVRNIATLEEFLSRFYPETVLAEAEASAPDELPAFGIWERYYYTLYDGELPMEISFQSFGDDVARMGYTGNSALIDIAGPVGEPVLAIVLEFISGNEQSTSVIQVLIHLSWLVELALVIALIVLPRPKRDPRRVMRVLAIVLVPVMLVLSLIFLISIIDGGYIAMGPKFTPAQEKLLARVIGFDLAPGESMDIRYAYHRFDEDSMYITVEGIASADDFLSRFSARAALAEWEKDEYQDYSLYGSEDVTLRINGTYKYATLDIDAPAGKRVLLITKAIMSINDPLTGLVFALTVLLPSGLLAEPALIIALAVLRRKAKKEQLPAGDGLPDISGK